MNDLIKKIETANLQGRGGTGFPVHRKLQAVLEAPGDTKYLICNASEGEPGVKKDWHLLDKHTHQVFEGMRIACQLLGVKKCWINCNHNYLKKLKKRLQEQVIKLKEHDIELVLYQEKKDSYLGGESSTILNAIERDLLMPRSKTVHAATHGLHGKPTLINNVETFYDIAQVANKTYDHTRLYTILGDTTNTGVFRYPVDMSVAEILKQTHNQVTPETFIQIGGGACGEIKRGNDLTKPATGAGSIEIFSPKTTPTQMLTRWLEFFSDNLCGTCTPCRDGVPQILKLIKENQELPWDKILDITETQRNTAFCGLGKSIDTPVRSLYQSLQK